MEWAQLPAVQFGALGLLLVVVWMVISGRLVSRRVHEDRLADLRARLDESRAEVAEYKAAWLAGERARHEQDNQLVELMELARTSNQAIQAMARRDEGPADVVAP